MPEQPVLPMLDAALRGALLALLLLLAQRLWRDRRGSPAARVGTWLMLGLSVQVLGSQPQLEAQMPCLWQAPLVGVAVANAALFWIFARALFDDDFVWQPGYAWVWWAVFVLGVTHCASASVLPAPLAQISFVLLRAMPLLFAVLAAMAAAAQWRTDLVEKRRRLRVFILLTGVLYSLAMLAARLASPQGRLTGAMATLDVLMLLLIVAVSASQLLRLFSDELFPPLREIAANSAGLITAQGPSPKSAASDPVDDHLKEALAQLMQSQRPYREDSVSVASLAAKLKVPEYRLRRVINQGLGHRNFNSYINGFRLTEACQALADPAQRDLPVLTIALTAGFQSIGPFNRAFKTVTSLTPTEFRRQKLADS
jgi:AraC-like DNA-binding protein